MKRFPSIIIFLALVGTAIATPNRNLMAHRFSGYTISRKIATLWLVGRNRPLVMVYFCGPDDWHLKVWNINSKFDEGKQGWAELQSENARLRVEIDAETGDVGVQSRRFKIREDNVFLVLHTGELFVPQKVIPLGHFHLPRSGRQPAPILLLRAHQELIPRINAEVRAGDHRMQVGNTARRHLTTWPCTERRLDLLNEVGPLSGVAVPFSLELHPGRILRTAYSVPCCRNHGSCNW